MSSSCNILVDEYSILSHTEMVIPETMPMFRESDRKVYSVKDENNDDVLVYEYSNTVEHVTQRLNILGYSLRNIKEIFEIDRLNTIQELRSKEEEGQDFSKERNSTKIKVLEEYSFEDWIGAFKQIRERGLTTYWLEKSGGEMYTPLIKYILTEEDYMTFYNFPGGDLLSVFRLFLETCPPDAAVRLDISDLVDAGWYDPDEAICEETLNSLKRDYPINEKIIILTEGSSDKNVLEKTLGLLFPHLVGYYSFMNFTDSNAEGGAARLVSLVKSFVGSGISNRVIAIFDNDTAAKGAISSLSRINLPKNIRVLQYPNIEIAKDYPALGPNGIIKTDINGLACSIELFLGKDVLTLDENLTPIQWKGYDQSIKQYQGEIVDKLGVQKRFQRKLKDATKDSSLILDRDWEELKVLWSYIFKTFE